MAGFSNKGSAQTNLAKVFRKLKGEGAASPETKKKGGGRKRKAGEYISIRLRKACLLTPLIADDDSEQNEEEETPSKKKGRTKKGTQEQKDVNDALVKSEAMDEELD